MSLVRIEAASPDVGEFVYDHLTLQFTILELVLAIIAFGTAIVAVFGYQGIKNGAEGKAKQTAEDYLRENAQSLIQDEVKKVIVLQNIGVMQPSYSLEQVKAETKEDNIKAAEEKTL